MKIFRVHFKNAMKVDADVSEFEKDGMGAMLDRYAAQWGGVDRIEPLAEEFYTPVKGQPDATSNSR